MRTYRTRISVSNYEAKQKIMEYAVQFLIFQTSTIGILSISIYYFLLVLHTSAQGHPTAQSNAAGRFAKATSWFPWFLPALRISLFSEMINPTGSDQVDRLDGFDQRFRARPKKSWQTTRAQQIIFKSIERVIEEIILDDKRKVKCICRIEINFCCQMEEWSSSSMYHGKAFRARIDT